MLRSFLSPIPVHWTARYTLVPCLGSQTSLVTARTTTPGPSLGTPPPHEQIPAHAAADGSRPDRRLGTRPAREVISVASYTRSKREPKHYDPPAITIRSGAISRHRRALDDDARSREVES